MPEQVIIVTLAPQQGETVEAFEQRGREAFDAIVAVGAHRAVIRKWQHERHADCP
jgi:hypothetical protein